MIFTLSEESVVFSSTMRLLSASYAALSKTSIVSSLPDTFSVSATCVESNGSDALSTDSTIPDRGTVLYFLTRAGNSCDDGTSGDGTSGGPRAARSCQ